MRRKIIFYNPKLKQRAKNLRNNSTLSEVLLWKYLKGKQIKGYDFHRQKPIDNYIVDFFCPELMLALEIDGVSHIGKEKDIYDRERQKLLESFGVKFLRFNDIDVKKNIEGVLMKIEGWIDKYTQPTPNPSQEGNNKLKSPLEKE
jgi:very-short-patch-repair endonuclease